MRRAGFFYFAICLLWFPSVFLNFSSSLAGIPGDNYLFVWHNWWLAHSLFVGRSPFFTKAVFFPEGISLGTHTLSLLNSIPGAFLSFFLNPVQTYNLQWLLTFVLSSTAMYAVAFDASGARLGSLLAGFVFGFSYFRLSHGLGHLNLLSTYFLPAVVLFAHRYFVGGGKKNFVLLVGSVVLTGYGDWYHLVAALIITIVIWALQLSRWPGIIRDRRCIVAIATSLVFLLPILIPLFQNMRAATLVLEKPGPDNSADLWAIFVPNFHPFLAGRERILAFFAANPYERSVYLGWVSFGFALCGWFHAPKRWARLGGILILFGFALAVGPAVYWKGSAIVSSPWTPYALLSNFVPGVIHFRAPSRFLILTFLGMCLLIPFGIQEIQTWMANHLKSDAVTKGALGVLLGLAALELYPGDYPMTPHRLPAIYQTIARDKEKFAVAEFPLHSGMFFPKYPGWQDRIFQYYQVYHGKPLLCGYTARADLTAIGFLETFMRSSLDGTLDAAWFERQKIRFALFHVDRLEPQTYARYWGNLSRWGREVPSGDPAIRALQFY
ncbi:MAG TPA: hypothetical protein VI895_04300 [Bdellovibrionota bacterium]|nr:hypothetical protein [Bdellovibrionota bacterium]